VWSYIRHSEYALYACMRTQLASPAESGWNDHHHHEIMIPISPAEAHKLYVQKAIHICNSLCCKLIGRIVYIYYGTERREKGKTRDI